MSSELIRGLRRNPELLETKNKKNDSAQPFYELLSGAIIWDDEIDRDWPTEVAHALRVIFAYRTSCFTGNERTEFRDAWCEAKQLFPTWVGFSETRVNPKRGVIELYWRRKEESLKELDDLFDAPETTEG